MEDGQKEFLRARLRYVAAQHKINLSNPIMVLAHSQVLYNGISAHVPPSFKYPHFVQSIRKGIMLAEERSR